MVNCLVTKLQSVVENDTLEKFNTKRLRVYRNSSQNQFINLSIPDGKYIEIKKVGGDADAGPQGKRTTGQSIAISGESGTYVDIEIYNYFNMQNFFTADLYEYDISLLGYNTTTTAMNFNASNTAPINMRISGNISSLSRCTQLTSIVIRYCQNLKGAIEDLAAGQVANGRISGTLVVNMFRCGVTYKGATLQDVNKQSVTITFDPTLSGGYEINLA